MATIVLPHHLNLDNKWIDLLTRSGHGFASVLFGFFDLCQFIEMRCTSCILDIVVLHHIQNNPVYDPTTRVYNIKNFMMHFPYALAISLPLQYTNHRMLNPKTFVGKKFRSLDLYGVDFTEIPDFNPVNFTGVETLCLQHCVINNEQHFQCMKDVRSLVLRESSVEIAGIDCFPHLQSLEHLDISHVNRFITPDCLEYLDGITKFIAQYCDDVTDDVIAVLTRSGCLQELDITGCTNPALTSASIPLLKSVPMLTLTYTNIKYELCDVCGRKRDISNISYHLTYECNMNCQYCDQTIEIYNESRHLATECTQNHIECDLCNVTILRKNLRRHRNRCMNRMVTCTHCNDTEPYYKKDHCFHLQNYEENSFKHFKSLKQNKNHLTMDLDDLQQEINDLIADVHAAKFKLHELRIPPKHTMFIRQMERNVAKHAKKPLKQLYVQVNMMTQLLAMRQKHKVHVEHILDDMEEQMRDEEEYWSHRSYMYDIDEDNLNHRRD